MARKPATLRDIAKLAGVGVSTVSYVLNGDEGRVSPGTKEQILAAARELNYRPNAIARSMAKQKTATIGLIITELQNPLFVPVTEGVEEVLRLEGYHIVLASTYDLQSEINAIELLRAQQVDGFILMSLSVHLPSDHLAQLDADDVPFVVINRDLEAGLFNQIHFDDRGAGRTATQHLIDLGHRRIATISGVRESTAEYDRRRSAIERHQGWQDALESSGSPSGEDWVFAGNYTYEGGYRAAQQLVAQARNSPQPPTGVFIASDMMAIGALRGFFEAGLRIPQDLAVTTIGDPPYAAYTIPPLTTLSLPVVEAGRVAARLLIDWLKFGKPAQSQQVLLDFELIIRASCGASLKT